MTSQGLEVLLVVSLYLAIAIFFLSSIAFWLVLLWPLLRGRAFRTQAKWRFAILQMTIVLLLASALTFADPWIASGLINPPAFAWFFAAHRLPEFSDFLAGPFAVGTATAVGAFVLWRKALPRSADFSWSIAAVVAYGTTFLAAAWWADREQSRILSEFKPDCVVRYSFLHSVRISGREFQFDLHLKALKDGQLFGWSFREMNLYPISRETHVPGGHSCAR